MRIVKLSKEALGVYTLAGCKAFFETVLPCENNEFDMSNPEHFTPPVRV